MICRILLPYPVVIQLPLTGNMGMQKYQEKSFANINFPPKINFGDFNNYFQ